jgi:hypothetical protein
MMIDVSYVVLSKLQMFLPEMEKENKILEQDISKGHISKYNIEIEEQDEEKPVIEMVLSHRALHDLIVRSVMCRISH